MQFPDPHWKMRNRKKRIVQPQLVEGVAKLLAAGGRVFLQSDVQEVRPHLSNALHGIKHRLACCCKDQSCLSGKAKNQTKGANVSHCGVSDGADQPMLSLSCVSKGDSLVWSC